MWTRLRSERRLAASLLAVLASAAPPGQARASDDASAEAAEGLDASRARFRRGMEAYASGDFAGAIVTWEAIYAELGRERGYRLAFNLARAYEGFGDASRAAERYTAYLDEVARRRAAGEALPDQVERQARDAVERLAELGRTRARLRVAAGPTPVVVRVDRGAPRLAGFLILVPPGRHTVVFGEGASAVTREVDLTAGEERTLEPPPPPAPPPPPQVERPPSFETRTVRPFAPAWIYVGAGVTAVSVLVPALLYGRALSTAAAHDASGDALERERLAAEYAGQKAGAYASLTVPVLLGAATAGLAISYFVGTKTQSVRVGLAGTGLGASLRYER